MAKTSVHYVDNKKFLEALKEYRQQVASCQEKPPIPDYIGECFLKIATHLSHKPNFMSYTYRDDMISDGVENCLIYFHNFDPEKSSNPFGYFTQIIYYAFLRRIQREKRHTYVKYRMLEQAIINGETAEMPDGSPVPVDSTMLNFDNVQDFISRYDEYTHKRRSRRKTKGRSDEVSA